MIASPDTAACPARPRWPCPDPSAAAAPPTQKINANAAKPSAVARRRSDGRSGKDGPQRHADDLEAAVQPAERELAQVVLGGAEHGCGVALPGQLQRVGDVREELAERRPHGVGLLRAVTDRFAEEPDAVRDVPCLV